MKIVKIMNNNVVSALDERNCEIILMGKGVGFGCRPGMEADMSLVEKRFFPMQSSTHMHQLVELLERIPLEHFAIGLQIVEHVQSKINKPLNEALCLMISDHISFAIERQEKRLDLTNALLWETMKFYPEEYRLGIDALDIIEREAGVRLSDDEAGFLAMHFVNAQYGSGDAGLARDMVRLIQDVVNLVRYTYGIELDENSLDYIRFITHLKFFLSRIFKKATHTGNEELYGIVSGMYPKATACVRKISAYLRQKLDYSLSLEEESYLIIHIEKLTRPR